MVYIQKLILLKLKDIKSLSEMYEFIGSEFGKDEDDLEIIIKSYERAKKKGYILEPYMHINSNTYNYSRGEFKRSRGNPRGNRDGRGRGNKKGY